MKLILFSVHDSKAGAYNTPIFQQSTGVALRMFEKAAREEGHAFNNFAGDYTLFEVGTFDDSNCEIKMYDVKLNLACAIDFAGKPTLGQVMPGPTHKAPGEELRADLNWRDTPPADLAKATAASVETIRNAIKENQSS